jgi:hypothetical protein
MNWLNSCSVNLSPIARVVEIRKASAPFHDTFFSLFTYDRFYCLLPEGKPSFENVLGALMCVFTSGTRPCFHSMSMYLFRATFSFCELFFYGHFTLNLRFFFVSVDLAQIHTFHCGGWIPRSSPFSSRVQAFILSLAGDLSPYTIRRLDDDGDLL